MAFDIDKMKVDGVSPHLIELAELSERNDTAAFEKIAMGIENTEIFRQFISMEADAPVWDYMYAAGLCTKDEADWFKSEENPYKPQSGEIWFTSTDEEGQVSFSTEGEKTENGATTNKTYQEWLDLFDNASQYELTLKAAHGEWQMQYSEDDGEKRFSCPDGQDVPYFTASEYMGQISVGGETESEHLPVDIIVTKK